MEIESSPVEIDEIDRRIMQLEIEREALKNEKDDASKARREAIEAELAELNETPRELKARWQAEKEAIEARHGARPSSSTQARGELEQAKRDERPRARGASCSTARSPSSSGASPSRRTRCRELRRGRLAADRGGRPRRTSPRSSAAGPASRSRG